MHTRETLASATYRASADITGCSHEFGRQYLSIFRISARSKASYARKYHYGYISLRWSRVETHRASADITHGDAFSNNRAKRHTTSDIPVRITAFVDF